MDTLKWLKKCSKYVPRTWEGKIEEPIIDGLFETLERTILKIKKESSSSKISFKEDE